MVDQNGNSIPDRIEILVENGKNALAEMVKLSQEQVDHIVKEMALTGLDNHMRLAKMAVEETKRGVYEDKIIKNLFATEYVYHSIKYQKTVGIIEDNEEEDYFEIAEPVGVIAGITPVTNPTSTTLFKAIIAMKTRNPIVFAFHPHSQYCSAAAAKVMRDATIKAGAPEYCIQWTDEPSLEATQALMKNDGISLILATGGSSMVKAAYSAGKPALGVGPGNVPCYIEKTADIKRAVTDLIMSKTLDNGMICASEQAVIIDTGIYDAVTEYMKNNNCYFVNEEERQKLEKTVFDEHSGNVNPEIVGRSACAIAQMSGFKVPADTKILVAELAGVGPGYPLSREKLSPVLACYKVADSNEGIQRAVEMINFGGAGHSAVIHSNDDAVINQYAKQANTGRIIINQPSSHGAIGDIYNTSMPSLTLGCGSFGRNSTTANVTAVNLINKKRVVKRRYNMQWFKIPEKIYFQPGSVQYLSKMPNITKAFIVTDKTMEELGFVEKVLYHLRNREGRSYVHSEIFNAVQPDPTVETVFKGVETINKFQPDVIIALGGGSVIDAAKAIWLFYEHPETNFDDLRMKFMDIRKKVVKYPPLGTKAKFVAIPTTSGTGSEVSSFTVITDPEKEIKYPLADYELTPDVAIVDPDFVQSVPPTVTADTGMDVLTHAIEAYVSVMASDYTDALAMKAIQLVFDYLPRAYQNGEDKIAREKMHNASCIAGMAFANAFLGINHSLAHKLGGEFPIPHGKANAVLLPYVIRYNSSKPTKFNAFPKYEHYIADEKYAEIAKYLGLSSRTTGEGVNSLIDAIRDLMKKLHMPLTIQDCGIPKNKFFQVLDELADKAFEDQCTTANPRLPLVSELKEIYHQAYKGES
ncbi:bifunctional acetaldehyde-CoA/alcohol dehydrogenase [Sporomusa acidovorans]|uniref:Aldehyde-alcohol dehydrogenase n=1 Tax=Sporomusa acidovorans (strain ATCC 49682 / DSM 3132 / Mol) TaxID=1123286 RepID=A0ABZ3IY71_SPOA4|nr:bifunctional acetaldehyde-CoA/alcohol dehydrogenase [Sporomusa acidovorans]OZC17718.1 aldehyde-alcohol dehydrogenase [Sporomusa acidovorans DSM 3132]SDE12941.1 acetaldehyde dehydrogenase /alcohol dehydrogenase AdhE [Sporomusa acidovorans]